MTINSRLLGRWVFMMVIASLMLATVGTRNATAQSPSNQFGAPSIRRPTTSPYLNLFRDNNSNNRALDFGLNYQRLVRPERELRNYSAQLNNQVNTLQNDFNSVIAADGSIKVPGTGHQTSFMNTGGYFSSNSGGTGRGGGAVRGGGYGNTTGGGFGTAGGYSNNQYGQIGSRMGMGGGQNMLGSRTGRSFGSPPTGQQNR
ncbi:MAG: hypothetical protein JNG89_10570 [Planctomycetaceae bacterium]|nr:hypothetical protein [Planctomycetaceae bacterium]